MTKNKYVNSLIYLFLTIIFISIFSTISKYRFLSSSFKVNSNREMINLNISQPVFDETDSIPLNRITFLNVRNRIFFRSNYTLSFFLKTKPNENNRVNFFYSTNNLPAGSIFWNINLVDGQLQMSRACGVPVTFIEKKINDGFWHHILIRLKSKNVSTYIDNELVSSLITDNRCKPENWFVINTGSYSNSYDKVFLKDFYYLGKPVSPKEFTLYSNYFSGITKDLVNSIIFSFIFNLLTVFFLFLAILAAIKLSYRLESFRSIAQKISSLFPLWVFILLPFWVNQNYWLSYLIFFLFVHLLLSRYRKLLSKYLRDFIEIPFAFLYQSLRFLVTFKLKRLFSHLRSLDSLPCFYILFHFGFFLAFDYFIFNIVA